MLSWNEAPSPADEAASGRGRTLPPILEPAEHSLDEVSGFVGQFVKRVKTPARWVVRDGRQGSALGEDLAQSVAVIGGICGQVLCWRQGCNQCQSRSHITQLARRDLESQRPTFRIDYRVDFGGATAARPANRLRVRPPFPPPAE